MKRLFVLAIFTCAFAAAITAQSTARYSYAAQRKFIPTELGRVYLGMPLQEFARIVDLSKAEANARFGPLEIEVPYVKGQIMIVRLKAAGISPEETEGLLRTETVKKKGEFGEFEEEVGRIQVQKVPKAAFVYEISVVFAPKFNGVAYATKLFGKSKDVYKPSDGPRIYDIQWTAKTSDGLVWLVRYYKNTNTLHLIGHIPGTEWSVEELSQ